MRAILFLAVFALVAAPAFGQPSKQTAGELQTAINDLHVLGQDFWIYNNLSAAVAQAKKTNKPIFMTFRCVPCKACAGFDAEVAKGSEGIKKLAQEKFVSLRQVEMKGVDLSQFQFDYDLNWAAMFINADGTVYARYGTQSIDGPDAYNSIASLEKTMQRVLELHDNYEKVKASLAGKRGADQPYKTPLDMPGMENKEKLAGTTARNNCVHCHMIHDAQQNQWRNEGTMSLERLYRWPLPDNLGMHIDPKDGRTIEKIIEKSPAAQAGFVVGDEITRVNGQPITSIADMQWVLQNTPNEDGAKVEIATHRDGKTQIRTVELAKGWKKTEFLWRASRWNLRPDPGFWAPLLAEKDIKALGDAIPASSKPLRVQWINAQRSEGRAAKEAGLKEGDIVVRLNGKPMSFTPEAFQMHVRLNCKVGDNLNLKILRNGESKEIVLTLVE